MINPVPVPSSRALAPRLAFVIAAAALPAASFRIAQADFGRFTAVLDCRWDGENCPGAADGFAQAGLAGEEIADPAAPELAAGGKVVLGLLEGKTFSFGRYAADAPGGRNRWIVLNEISSGDQNNVFLTLWKRVKDSLEFVKIHPGPLPLDLGETHVHALVPLPDQSRLLILKGEGADAGITLQDYRFLRLQGSDRAAEIGRHTNRSRVPVGEILEKLNNDEPVEAVIDSSLACEIVKGRKAPSGGPLIRLVTTRTRILYTKAGPEETPLDRSERVWDVWKEIRAGKPAPPPR